MIDDTVEDGSAKLRGEVIVEVDLLHMFNDRGGGLEVYG